LPSLIVLVEKACAITLLGYIIARSSAMRPFVEGRPAKLASQLALGIVFGLFSIYGTVGGVPVHGALISIRDTGPIIAGLLGGPLPGVVAGLIGGGHRLWLVVAEPSTFGFTALPCSVSTVLIGLVCGLVRQRWGLVWPLQAALVAALCEVGHNGLALVLSGRPEQMFTVELARYVWHNIVAVSAPWMVLANAVAAGVFFAVLHYFRRELQTGRERDNYYGEVEQRNAELRSVYEIAQAITASSTDPDEALGTILGRVREMVPCAGAEICLYEPNQDLLRVRAVAGEGRLIRLGDTIPMGTGYAGWIGQNRRALLVSDARNGITTELPVSPTTADQAAPSYVGVPLAVGEELEGTLGLTGTDPGSLDEHAQRLLETIAPQAAIGIRNARRVQEHEEELRRELEAVLIEIDEAKRRRQVSEITGTDYFQSLRRQAAQLRQEQGARRQGADPIPTD
jgi:GAF domain-containing protein